MMENNTDINSSEKQFSEASRLQIPVSKSLQIGSSNLEFRFIPSGEFIMGAQQPSEPTLELNKKNLTGTLVATILMLLLLSSCTVVIIRLLNHKIRWMLMTCLTAVAFSGILISFYISELNWHETALAGAKANYIYENKLFVAAKMDQLPAHQIKLKPFYLSTFEIQQGIYTEVTGKNLFYFNNDVQMPADCTWEEGIEFCEKLSERFNTKFRLPTEAEWEYACRCGSARMVCNNYYGKEQSKIGWFSMNSDHTAHYPGLKLANDFGLHDMHGNLSEWCMDWYSENYYQDSIIDNPRGPERGSYKVIRGESWCLPEDIIIATRRYMMEPDDKTGAPGIRIVMEIDNSE
jgi:hypothetical protein